MGVISMTIRCEFLSLDCTSILFKIEKKLEHGHDFV
jgi:hypothetical protein